MAPKSSNFPSSGSTPHRDRSKSSLSSSFLWPTHLGTVGFLFFYITSSSVFPSCVSSWLSNRRKRRCGFNLHRSPFGRLSRALSDFKDHLAPDGVDLRSGWPAFSHWNLIDRDLPVYQLGRPRKFMERWIEIYAPAVTCEEVNNQKPYWSPRDKLVIVALLSLLI